MNKHHKALLVLGLGITGLAAVVGVGAINKVNMSQSNQNLGIQTANAQTMTAQARQQQDKPIVAKIYADWCSKCQAMKPTIASLQQRYGNSANFVIFDVTNREKLQASEAKARELGLTNFLNANKSRPATVAVINPTTNQTVKQFFNNTNQQDYANAINSAIAQIQRR